MQINNPLISVVIPTYNRESTIEKALLSVLNQTYKNIEVIIIDDASQDKTHEVIKSYLSDKVLYFKLEKNGGVSDARNYGIKKSHGEYIAFQDSDDEWYSSKLEKQIAVINQDDSVGLVYCRFKKILDKSTYDIYPKHSEALLYGDLKSVLIDHNIIGTPTMLIKKKVLDDIGLFDTKMIQYEDWDLALRVSIKYSIGFVDEVLVDSHMSSKGVNSDKGLESKHNMLYFIFKHINSFSASQSIMLHYIDVILELLKNREMINLSKYVNTNFIHLIYTKRF
jgi:glycosyltransferase involved in cell wall biosynthesis